MKLKIFTMLLLVLTATLTGCFNGSRSGVTGWNQDSSSGSFAPDIPFTTSDGKETRFNSIRQPVAILAFVSPSPQDCCSIRPDLAKLAKRFKLLPITVAQISLTTTECPYGPGCNLCDIVDNNLVTLCDPARIAWKAYNQPKLNTVILVNQRNRIVDTQPISNLDVLADKAENIVEEIEEDNIFCLIDCN